MTAGARSRFAALIAALAAMPAQGQVWEVGNQLLWHPGGTGQGDFGEALAVGDFDADGYDDLAVGAGDANGNDGLVDVYKGGPNGLSTAIWHTVVGSADSRLGQALAAGDFDGDGRDELAIGAPEQDDTSGQDPVANAGRVWVLEVVGSDWLADTDFSQAGDIAGALEPDDNFGRALGVGDFDDDGRDDLAVGATGEAVGALGAAGAVVVVYGTASGLAPAGSQIWNLSGGGLTGTAAAGDGVGSALAGGDFDGDGVDDLALSAPYRTVSGQADAGAVWILFGVDESGLTGTGQQLIDSGDLGYTLDDSQWFGSSLAAADFNLSFACIFLGTCAEDLAIGAPGEDSELGGDPVSGAGIVHLVYGSQNADGLDPGAEEALDASTIDPAGGAPEPETNFGGALAAGELDGLPGVDIAIGASFDQSGLGAAGVVAGEVVQKIVAREGLPVDPPTTNDRLGTAVAIGDFDGDGTGDLAIGVAGRDSPDGFGDGVVLVLYGALFADGFERGDTTAWP